MHEKNGKIHYVLLKSVLSLEKHDKKDTKLPLSGKIASFHAFLDRNWLGVSFGAALKKFQHTFYRLIPRKIVESTD